MEFINTGLDERILKSLDVEHPSEELVKAMNKQGLVQKEVTVQGKNGTFTRKQWVKAGEDGGSSHTSDSPKKADSKKFDPFQVGGNNVTHYINRKKFPPTGGVSSAYLAGKNIGEVLSGQSKEFVSKTAKDEAIRATKEAIRAHKRGLKDPNYRDTLYTPEKEQKIIDAATELLSIIENVPIRGESSNPTGSTSESKTGGPVDISKFSFTNYLNPDGQNRNGYKTYKDSLQSVANETEKAATRVLSTYGGSMKPYDQLRIEFGNINGHSSYRDMISNSSQQGLKDAKAAIVARQKELLESVKDYTEWDSSQKKWIKASESKDSSASQSTETNKKSNKPSSSNSIKLGSTVEILRGSKKGTQGKITNIQENDDEDKSELGEFTYEVTTTDGNKRYLSETDLKIKNVVEPANASSDKLSPADAKKKTQEITKGVSDKKSFMEKAKAQGITWKENDHEGINWMRCCMAMNKHFENGGSFDEK